MAELDAGVRATCEQCGRFSREEYLGDGPPGQDVRAEHLSAQGRSARAARTPATRRWGAGSGPPLGAIAQLGTGSGPPPPSASSLSPSYAALEDFGSVAFLGRRR